MLVNKSQGGSPLFSVSDNNHLISLFLNTEFLKSILGF